VKCRIIKLEDIIHKVRSNKTIMKKIILTAKISIILSIIVYLIFYISIGSDKFQKFKDYFPNYLGWKDKIKHILFSNREDVPLSILIKSDGSNSFKLNDKNLIYIYSNIGANEIEDLTVPSLINLEKIGHTFDLNLEAVLKDQNVNCFSKRFKKDFKIKISSFSDECKKGIFYIGKLKYRVKKDIILKFYFRVDTQNKGSKNLLILPTTNFYSYNSNSLNINSYTSKIDYLAMYNEIPNTKKPKWEYSLIKSIQGLSGLVSDFDIALDSELENMSLKNYNLIIFPMHQEKVSIKMLNKLKIFLNDSKKNNILSIGGANFRREVLFKNNSIIFYKDKLIKQDEYFNITYANKGIYKNCTYEDNKNLRLGEKTNPQKMSSHTDFYLHKINCDDNKKIPLLSSTRFNDNGNLIHIMTDGIGLSINEISDLKEIIHDLLNN
jgi:hypothetical protein